MDFASSTDPAVQAQLDRLFAHGPGTDTLGLDRITRLLARLGDPHRHLPPVFHVAGTNGKGSTCAFLRAALEAAGHRVHVYTSPHLVRFNERIRLAGRLIDDAHLAPLLTEVLDAAEDLRASFFEVTTAAAFLAFARTPADACVIEVGLGGRLDATNVIERPATCGIAALGMDHEAFLLAPETGVPADPRARIAFEKAGIAKRGVPLVTLAYTDVEADAIAAVAAATGAVLRRSDEDWHVDVLGGRLHYADGDGELELPLPSLVGAHQVDNAAVALAMLRFQSVLPVDAGALAEGLRNARWPARLQPLGEGPLTAGRQVWVDGAHNPHAARWVARALPVGFKSLVIGVLANKDAEGVLRPLIEAELVEVIAVPVPGHAHHRPADLAALALRLGAGRATTAAALPEAMQQTRFGFVLIAGSLYLAGEALRLNGELPD